MVFGRLKKKQPAGGDAAAAAETEPAIPAPGAVDPRRANGPFDESEIDSGEGYVDLGALRIKPREGLQLRLEVEERTQRVVAVTLDLEGSSLQLQAFAAPRSEGLWDDIREQIASSVSSQGGTVDEVQGTFGAEMIARVPVQSPDGTRGFRIARFVGVDGPRWFLRGVFGGAAAHEGGAVAELEALFRDVVVVRGEQPLPPRDLLQLRLPKDAAAAPGPTAAAPPSAENARNLSAPRRGPEVTQIG